MSDTVIQVADLGKRYRLGVVGTGTLSHDLNRWWAKVRGRPDPTLKVGQTTVDNGPLPVDDEGVPSSAATASEYMWALKDVSFEVRRGEILGIIGGNGAGKSTVLKILSRVTAPTTGEVRVRGRIASLLEVGTGFHPELTGRENIFLNGAILGMRKAEIARKFDEIVAFSDVEEYVDTPVKRYSSGMHVRLAFAVAAHLEPEILLVDEVLAVGDTAFQKKCLGKMGAVAREGRTVLFVSHNMGAVSSLCDRGVVLNKGRIECEGRIDSVVSHYLKASGGVDYSGDLVGHPNRTRGLKPLLRSFEVESDCGTVHHGEPLTMRIGYQFPNRIAVPQFCASFVNERGIVAFTLISDYQPNDIPQCLQGTGEVECRIRSLPLLPGSYTVNLKLWRPGEKLDDVENVARVTVEWMNRELGQFQWDSSMGVVYVDATWSMRGGDLWLPVQDESSGTAAPLLSQYEGSGDA